MNSCGVYTEIPTPLKRLVRLVMRGFYTIQHSIVMDMLIRNPCMKEDDIIELLKFERKQFRSLMAQLKHDRFVKVRLRMETGRDGKATRQNYYYISYKLFVNVVKYKLDHMRRKIETEERDSTSRASFKCTRCRKKFTDLDADQLFDFSTGEFRCSYCNAPVDEDESALPKTDSRLLLARFNEQIEPLYSLLREIDDMKLAPELLEPEPTDMAPLKKDIFSQKNNKHENPADDSSWSGDATRNKNYLICGDQSITINFEDNKLFDKPDTYLEKKEQPVWMTQSTVKNETSEFGKNTPESNNTSLPDMCFSSGQNPDDIMEALLAHERKTGESVPTVPGQESNDDTSSDSEDNCKFNLQNNDTNVEEMDSDDDEETLMIQIGDQRVSLADITVEHVAKMSTVEKETYIRLTQDLYASMYD